MTKEEIIEIYYKKVQEQYVEIDRYKKTNLNLQAEIEKKDKQISRLTDLSINLNKEIDKLKLIAGIALKGRPIEISKKALNELENTIEIEQTENMINDSFIFKAR